MPFFMSVMFSMLYVSLYGIRMLHYIPSLSKMNTLSLPFPHVNNCINSVGLDSLHLCILSSFVVSQWTTAAFRLNTNTMEIVKKSVYCLCLF